MAFNILVINPGSTSDDIGYYRGDKPVFEVTVRYSIADLEPYEGKNVTEQLPLSTTLSPYSVLTTDRILAYVVL